MARRDCAGRRCAGRAPQRAHPRIRSCRCGRGGQRRAIMMRALVGALRASSARTPSDSTASSRGCCFGHTQAPCCPTCRRWGWIRSKVPSGRPLSGGRWEPLHPGECCEPTCTQDPSLRRHCRRPRARRHATTRWVGTPSRLPSSNCEGEWGDGGPSQQRKHSGPSPHALVLMREIAEALIVAPMRGRVCRGDHADVLRGGEGRQRGSAADAHSLAPLPAATYPFTNCGGIVSTRGQFLRDQRHLGRYALEACGRTRQRGVAGRTQTCPARHLPAPDTGSLAFHTHGLMLRTLTWIGLRPD